MTGRRQIYNTIMLPLYLSINYIKATPPPLTFLLAGLISNAMGKYKVEITAENFKFLDQEAGLLIRFPEQIPMDFFGL